LHDTSDPNLTKNLEEKLLELGFKPLRQKGSHVFYHHPDGRSTAIPFHGSCDIGPVLLNKILKEIKIDRKKLDRV